MDDETLNNFELSCKESRNLVIQCSAWKQIVKRDFKKLFRNVEFEEQYSEHLYYKKKYRMFWIVGHDCEGECYNCCNICLEYTDCFYLSFCGKHSWSDYITKWRNICDGVYTWTMLIVTTPIESQFNSKVGFDMKMTLAHPPPNHQELNIGYWPDFDQILMFRFLGSTTTTTQQNQQQQ